jgi:hypothetical protein
MSTEDELAQLRRDVQYLKDRAEILDVVANQARGHDRHDAELLTDVYHSDGIDEHGATVNPGPAYGEWANRTHELAAQAHLHHITTHTCEIEGDTAHAESYVLGAMLSPDGKTASILSGRYLDRLERRDGRWRLALRRCTVEVGWNADASFLQTKFFARAGFLKGTWDRTDLSYTRPLTLESEPAPRW